MINIFRLFAICITISLVACSSPDRFPNTKGLKKSSSFGFITNGDEYYFGLTQRERKNNICNSYVGFKNGEKVFRFSDSHFAELNTIYDLKYSPEERISLALKRIKELSDLTPKETCRQKDEWKDGIVWIAIALAVWPAMIVAGGAEVFNNVTDKMDDIYLGMPLDEMKKALNIYQLRSRIENNNTYYVADLKGARMVMYFKNDKLTAFVRGGNPDYYKQR